MKRKNTKATVWFYSLGQRYRSLYFRHPMYFYRKVMSDLGTHTWPQWANDAFDAGWKGY